MQVKSEARNVDIAHGKRVKTFRNFNYTNWKNP